MATITAGRTTFDFGTICTIKATCEDQSLVGKSIRIMGKSKDGKLFWGVIEGSRRNFALAPSNLRFREKKNVSKPTSGGPRLPRSAEPIISRCFAARLGVCESSGGKSARTEMREEGDGSCGRKTTNRPNRKTDQRGRS